MGGCLPQPKQTTSTATPPPSSSGQASRFVEFVSSAPAITGPDVSNNDPLTCTQIVAVAKHSRLLYTKTVEGTAFTDSTAAAAATCAKAHGLLVGGYDFLHVCLGSPIAEGEHFVAAARAAGLLGVGTLRLAGDAEYPFGTLACNGRVWLQTWVDTVYNFAHACPIMYTGAWWWQPHVGSFWPTCLNVQLEDWISGYGVKWPFMPSGRSHLDLWQFTDRGFNGATFADLSVWENSPADFPLLEPVAPKPKPNRYAIYPARGILVHGVRLSERGTVSHWDALHCLNPVRRAVCRTVRVHLVWLRDRLDYVAHHPLKHGRATYNLFERGPRRAGIEHRLVMR